MDNKEIQNPSHYNWIPGIECIDVTCHFPSNLGNVIKYLWRCGRKDGNSRLKDLEKALVYLQHEIKLEKQKNEQV